MKKVILLVSVLSLSFFLWGCPPQKEVTVEGYDFEDGCGQVFLGAEIVDPPLVNGATFVLKKKVEGQMKPLAQVAYSASADVTIYEGTSKSGGHFWVMKRAGDWHYVQYHQRPLVGPVYVLGQPAPPSVSTNVDMSKPISATLFIGALIWLAGQADEEFAANFALPSAGSGSSGGDVKLPGFCIFRITDSVPSTYQIEADVAGWDPGHTERFTIAGNPYGCPPEESDDISVPGVSGLPQEEAEAEITGAGLRVGIINPECSAVVEAGRVIWQDPSAGVEVPEGSAINLAVSTGPCEVEIPDFRNPPTTEEDAERDLEDLGFTVVFEDECHDSVSAGYVIRTSPSAGQMLQVGETITVFVSSGKCPVGVPDLIGKTQGQAEEILNNLDLAGSFLLEYDSAPQGEVIGQSPGAGSEVAVGSTVTVTVSRGPKPPEMVTVPNVVGENQVDAEGILNSLNLLSSATLVYDSAPKGEVVDQDHEAGSEVEVGSTIKISVSKGPEPPEDLVAELLAVDDNHQVASGGLIYQINSQAKVVVQVSGGVKPYQVAILWPDAQQLSASGPNSEFNFSRVLTADTAGDFLPVRCRVTDDQGESVDLELMIRVDR